MDIHSQLTDGNQLVIPLDEPLNPSVQTFSFAGHLADVANPILNDLQCSLEPSSALRLDALLINEQRPITRDGDAVGLGSPDTPLAQIAVYFFVLPQDR